MNDTITCTNCGATFERIAQEGQELQPSPDFICDDCRPGIPVPPPAIHEVLDNPAPVAEAAADAPAETTPETIV